RPPVATSRQERRRPGAAGADPRLVHRGIRYLRRAGGHGAARDAGRRVSVHALPHARVWEPRASVPGPASRVVWEPRAGVPGRPHAKLGSTSRPNSSIASCISGTLLATKSIPENVVTPAAW